MNNPTHRGSRRPRVLVMLAGLLLCGGALAGALDECLVKGDHAGVMRCLGEQDAQAQAQLRSVEGTSRVSYSTKQRTPGSGVVRADTNVECRLQCEPMIGSNPVRIVLERCPLVGTLGVYPQSTGEARFPLQIDKDERIRGVTWRGSSAEVPPTRSAARPGHAICLRGRSPARSFRVHTVPRVHAHSHSWVSLSSLSSVGFDT